MSAGVKVRIVACSSVAFVALTTAVPAQRHWVQHGPRPNTLGQVENIVDREVAGAVNVIATHPTDPGVIFVGAVNGGIWRTNDARSANPTWSELLGPARSLSIGALAFDPADTTHRTLVAGSGASSSFMNVGGDRAGVLRTTDGGNTWQSIGDSTLGAANITAVAVRGPLLLVSSNLGVHRSDDSGATWLMLSGQAGPGLPPGPSFDLDSDPSNPSRFFTHAGRRGLYRTSDNGKTWARVGDQGMNQLITRSDRVEIAVGLTGNVFVAIVVGGELSGVFRSGDAGSSWSKLDLPQTTHNRVSLGVHPGRQGAIHISLVADRTDANVVYIGGDRQPDLSEFGIVSRHRWPNPIGASDYSGRLYRIDASRRAGQQAVPITHANTGNASAPHADSRDMMIDAIGDLIEADDGGVYRRSSPRTDAGDWFSLNGNLHVTEVHSVAWDAVSHVAISGAQDTGTPEQTTPTSPRWRSVSTGDGGDVAVDDRTTPGYSVRFSSYQNLADFRTQTFDSTNSLVRELRPRLAVTTGRALNPQFYTPIQLNTRTPLRLIVGAGNGVYESFNRGETLEEIAPGVAVNGTGSDPIAYGATDNEDALYVGSGDRLFVRLTAGRPLLAATTYPGRGTWVTDVVVDPDTARVAYVINETELFQTRDGGKSWTSSIGNLQSLRPGTLLSLAISGSDSSRMLIVGTSTGVFASSGPTYAVWTPLASGLPRVPVYDLAYSAVDHVVVAGTLGRGTWTVRLR